MSAKTPTAKEIDAILPQTQCGLCTYAGCMPYAEALANQTAEINLCPPGGVDGLLAIANLLKKDAAPFLEEMQQKAKPSSVAVIREAECIGCTKCIQACPVDAILGAAKQMHSVITDECTGCELCIAPCPVDCIDMVISTTSTTEISATDKSNHFRNRYLARQKRLQKKIHSTTSIDVNAALLRIKAKQNNS